MSDNWGNGMNSDLDFYLLQEPGKKDLITDFETIKNIVFAASKSEELDRILPHSGDLIGLGEQGITELNNLGLDHIVGKITLKGSMHIAVSVIGESALSKIMEYDRQGKLQNGNPEQILGWQMALAESAYKHRLSAAEIGKFENNGNGALMMSPVHITNQYKRAGNAANFRYTFSRKAYKPAETLFDWARNGANAFDKALELSPQDQEYAMHRYNCIVRLGHNLYRLHTLSKIGNFSGRTDAISFYGREALCYYDNALGQLEDMDRTGGLNDYLLNDRRVIRPRLNELERFFTRSFAN